MRSSFVTAVGSEVGLPGPGGDGAGCGSGVPPGGDPPSKSKRKRRRISMITSGERSRSITLPNCFLMSRMILFSLAVCRLSAGMGLSFRGGNAARAGGPLPDPGDERRLAAGPDRLAGVLHARVGRAVRQEVAPQDEPSGPGLD